jgi:predicted PurR-regulated permease PerM
MAELKRYLPLQNIAFPFLAVAAATAFLYFASPIVIPVIIAVSLAYILSPALSLLKRIKIPHAVAVLLVLIITSFVLGGIGYLLFVQVNNLTEDLPVYLNAVVEFSGNLLDRYREIFPQSEGLDTEGFQLKEFSGITKYLFRGISSTISFLFSVVLVLFLTFFILNDQNMLKNKLIRAFSKSKEGTGVEIMEKINTQIRGFLLVKFGTSFGMAVFFTLGLLIIGVNYAYVWGPLAGVLNLIPYVGPIIGAVPPLIVAAVQFKAWMPVIWVLILSLVLQNLEGNLITPKLMGDKLNLNPLAILVSVMFWTWLWGAIGILLAIPITASAKVICDHVEALQPIGILLGGKSET